MRLENLLYVLMGLLLIAFVVWSVWGSWPPKDQLELASEVGFSITGIALIYVAIGKEVR